MIFGLFRRQRIDPSPLLSSRLFDDKTFYTSFLHDLRGSRKEVLIESPFITKRRANQLCPVLGKLIRQGVKVTINTRDPQDHDVYMSMDARAIIEVLQSSGVQVLYTDRHHRKLAVIDGQILWEGSLNILSHNSSCEIMRRVESAALAEQMLGFLGLNKFLD